MKNGKPAEILGFPVVESDNLKTAHVVFGDMSAYIGTITLNHGTPITEAVQALGLNEAERAAVCSLPGVHTLGDLRIVLERKEIDDAKLAAKLGKVLTP
jgi:ADP-dependent phosphofructokinase/glucokinase